MTCSIASWAGLPRRAVYSASKGALYALTLAMAADHLKDGIRVNGVAPGTADTPWVARLLDAAPDPELERAALEARQPMGRLVTADEVAHAIAYLASPLIRLDHRNHPRSRRRNARASPAARTSTDPPRCKLNEATGQPR